MADGVDDRISWKPGDIRVLKPGESLPKLGTIATENGPEPEVDMPDEPAPVTIHIYPGGEGDKS